MGYRAMRNAKSSNEDELTHEYMYESLYDTTPASRDSRTIFIAIPCYSDPELIPTIFSALANAKVPERLSFGVGLIHRKDDEEWWKPLLDNPQVHLDIQLATESSVGLGNQRASANSFYNDETYYLQIDSHMRFDMNWDDLLIHHHDNMKALGEEKPLITGYPRGYAPDEFPNVKGAYPYYNPKSKELYFRQRRGHNNVPCFREGRIPSLFIKDYGFPRHGDRNFNLFETLAIAVCVSPAQIFVEGAFVHEVPANPKIRFLEEEQYYAVLAYMQGYTFYVPRVTGIMHYYTEAEGQELLPDRAHPIQDFPEIFSYDSYLDENYGGRKIFDTLMAMKDTPRSFSDYEAFAGVDYKNRRIVAPVNRMIQNKVTEAVNFFTELYEYSINDYIDWMYDADYEWYEDVKRNEGL